MENKNNVIIWILILAIILAGIFGFINESINNNIIISTYIGLTDKDLSYQVIALDEALNKSRDILRDYKLSYTESIAYAEYPANNEMLKNDTIKYEFFFTNLKTVEPILNEIIEVLNVSAASIKIEKVKSVKLNLY